MMHTARNMHQILDLATKYDELFDEIDIEGLLKIKNSLYLNKKDLKAEVK